MRLTHSWLIFAVLIVGCDTQGSFEWQQDECSESDESESVETTEVDFDTVRALIDSPREGECITDNVTTVSGTVLGLPKRAELFVALHDGYAFYVQYPSASVDRFGSLSQRNVRFGSDGKWDVHLIAASPSAARMFHARAARGDWSGMPSLPEGAVSLQAIHVTVSTRSTARP